MHRTSSLKDEANCDWSPFCAIQCRLQTFAHLLINVIHCLAGRYIKLTERPTHHVQITVFDSQNLSTFDSNQSTSLWAYLTDMSSLYVSRKYNPWILAHLFTVMDMAQRPVLVSFGPQPINGARCVRLVTRLTVQASVQQADVKELWISLRIGLRKVVRYRPCSETLTIYRHIQIIQNYLFRILG